MKIKDFVQTIKIVALAGMLAVGIGYLNAEYVGPSGKAPTINAATPVHIGKTTQIKIGGFGIKGPAEFDDVNKLIMKSGAKLTMESGATLTMESGAGAGKVLTSDAKGVVTWKDPSVAGADRVAWSNNSGRLWIDGAANVNENNAKVLYADTAGNGVETITSWGNHACDSQKCSGNDLIGGGAYRFCAITVVRAESGAGGDEGSRMTCRVNKNSDNTWNLEYVNVSNVADDGCVAYCFN